MTERHGISFHDIISLQNLCEAWREFVRGKKMKPDVIRFSLDLSKNLSDLHYELRTKTYEHGPYKAFAINDPKPRSIHKATVRDRLIHHAIYRQLYPFFDSKFIFDSYSCREYKGSHKALNRFRQMTFKASKNHHRTCWILKCDIRKFFASVDQIRLMEIFSVHVKDSDIVWLVDRVVQSFNSGFPGKGLPLGNLTSQLLVNVYMNEFDQYVKNILGQKFYIRYADDFVVMSDHRNELIELLPRLRSFLQDRLKLELHSNKVSIKTVASGIDFLGWVHFPTHRVLRTATNRRMFRVIKERDSNPRTIQSYLGLIGHGSTQKIRNRITSMINSDTT